MVLSVRILLIDTSENERTKNLEFVKETGFSLYTEQAGDLQGVAAALNGGGWDFIISGSSSLATDTLAYLRTHNLSIPFIIVADELPQETADAMIESGAMDCISREGAHRLAAVMKRELALAGFRRNPKKQNLEDGQESTVIKPGEPEENFRLVAENTSDVIWTADLNMRTRYISPSVEKLLGITVEEYLGLPIERRFLPDTVRRFSTILAEELQRENEAGVDKNRSILLEGEHFHPDGRILNLEQNMTFIRDEAGRVVGIQGVSRDITDRKKIEEDLRQSERHFRSLFESTAVGVAITDTLQGNYLHVNERFCEITGYSSEELTGMTWASMTHPDDLSANQEFMDRLQAGSIRNFSMEKRYIKKDGTTVWVGVSVASLWEPGEEANTTIAVIQDISASKASEQALRASEERFRRLSDDIPVCISSFLPDGTTTYVNTAQAKLIGKNPDELIGRKFLDLLDPEDARMVRERLKNLSPGNPIEHHEQKHQTPDRGERDIEWRNRAFFNSNGEKTHLLGVGIDITERKRAERAILKEKEKAQTYLDTAEVILVVLNRDETIDLMNKKGLRILGYEENEILGKNWFDVFIPKRMRKQVREAFEQIMAGRIDQFEYHENALTTKSGEERLIGWHNTIIRGEDGSITGSLSSGEDITERRRIEMALQKSEEKFSTAFHVSPDAININRMTDGMFIEINEGFTSNTGFTVEDIYGKTSLELDMWANPEDREKMINGLKESGQVNNLEVSFRIKNGEIRTTLMSARIIEVNGEKCILTITRDISDRKEMENALKQSEERYHLIDEASQDMIYSLDIDGHYTHANSSLCKFLGRKPEEIIGKTTADLGLSKQECESWDSLQRQVYESKNTVISEFSMPVQGKELSYFEVVLNPIRDETGRITGIVGTTRNIDERRRAEIQINQQLDELQRWHRATMGREERILELKREINRLLVETGQPPRYGSAGVTESD